MPTEDVQYLEGESLSLDSNDFFEISHGQKNSAKYWWNDLKPNERDCEDPYIVKPFFSIGLIGYSIEEAMYDWANDDDDGTKSTFFYWIQKMGCAWYNRLIDMSMEEKQKVVDDALREENDHSTTIEKTNTKANNHGYKEESDLLVMPTGRYYRDLNMEGSYIPDELLKSKKDKVILVSVIFDYDDMGEEAFMQINVRASSMMQKSKLIEISKPVNQGIKDVNTMEAIKKTWTFDCQDKSLRRQCEIELEKSFCSPGYWRHITSGGSNDIYGGEVVKNNNNCNNNDNNNNNNNNNNNRENELTKVTNDCPGTNQTIEKIKSDSQSNYSIYDERGNYKARPRLPLIQNIYSCKIPELYYDNGIVPMFTPHKEDAMEMARAMGLGVFAYDFYTGFAKKFVVCTAQAAYEMIHKRKTYCLPPADEDLHQLGYKSMYEGLIHSYPHKLILDLEYDRTCNTQWETSETLNRKNPPDHANKITLYMLDFVGQLLAFVNDDEWTPRVEDWIILEADSENKVSRHAILNAPGKFFRSMDDACNFRDIFKAFVEAGLVEKDPDVLKIMVNVRVKASKVTRELMSRASSPAQQCFINGRWKTCFNDWCVINNTFRLMRTCGSTKFGQDRYLKVAKDLNQFDIIDHEKNTMVALYKEAFGILPKDPVSPEWVSFMASLVQNPVPKYAPGWQVPNEKVETIVREMNKTISDSFDNFNQSWSKLMRGKTHKEKYGVVYCDDPKRKTDQQTNTPTPSSSSSSSNNKRTRNSTLENESSNSCSSIMISVNAIKKRKFTSEFSKRLGRIEKYTILPSDPLYSKIIKVLHLIRDLDPVVQNTQNWKLQACYKIKNHRLDDNDHEDFRNYQGHRVDDDDSKGPCWFSVFPCSVYCPIGAVHSSAGKTIININRSGKVTASCLSSRCSGVRWLASQKLSVQALHFLWD